MTLLLLHGTGGTEDDLIPLGKELAPDAAILSPRGKVMENGMPRFFRRLSEGVFDIEDLVFRTHELAEFVKAASEVYAFDQRRIVPVGYSNGANIASSLLFLHPRLLAGAVLFRAMVPFVPERLPELSHKPVFMSSGLEDQIVPRSQSIELQDLFRRSGAEVTLHWENATHALTSYEVKEAKNWLELHFPKSKQ